MRVMSKIWKDRPEPLRPLLQVGVTLGHLVRRDGHTPDLFGGVGMMDMPGEDVRKQERLDQALDELRKRYGRDCVYLGSVHESRAQAPMRISFNHVPDLDVEGWGLRLGG